MTNIVSFPSAQPAVSEHTLPDMFTVESAPISGPYGVIPNKKGLFVNSDNINIVSDRYEVHQPEEIWTQFAEVAEKTGLTIRRTLLNPKNGGMLIHAFYQNTQIVGESHDINICFYTSHCGKYKTFLTVDALRMACFNQVPMLYRGKERHIFAEKHYKNALDIRLIGEMLEHIPETIAIQNEKSERLIEKPLSLESFVELFAEHYNMRTEQKQFQSKVDKIKAIYNNAPGQHGLNQTAYKAYQAVTFNNTHELKKTAMRNENIMTKASADSLKFMDKLLQVA